MYILYIVYIYSITCNALWDHKEFPFTLSFNHSSITDQPAAGHFWTKANWQLQKQLLLVEVGESFVLLSGILCWAFCQGISHALSACFLWHFESPQVFLQVAFKVYSTFTLLQFLHLEMVGIVGGVQKCEPSVGADVQKCHGRAWGAWARWWEGLSTGQRWTQRLQSEALYLFGTS